MDRDNVICTCFQITNGDIEDAVKEGASTYEDLQDKTGCGTGCGCCEDEVKELLDELKK